MGRKPGYKQVTLYVEPTLYETVKQTAYSLREDVYEFVGEALASACDRRTTKPQRAAIDAMVKQNTKNGEIRGKRR